jgi:hypothetical protein
MIKMLWLPLLIAFSSPALAVYKCESNGEITYSDKACPGGKILELDAPLRSTAPASDPSNNQQQQVTREKDQLKRLENLRHKREAQEQKEQLKVNKLNAAKQRKCAALALRSKWSSEDATAANGKSTDKARRNAMRSAEKYAVECGK